MSFSSEQQQRYAQQLSIAEWSDEIQSALQEASVIVIGAGALGSPAAAYLAGAGVGSIGIVDGGTVELGALHRQLLHYTPDVGGGCADSAARKLGVLNPLIQVAPFPAVLDEQNAAAIVDGADVVLDCTGDFETRQVINKTCVKIGMPLVSATASGMAGAMLAVIPGETACIECWYPAQSDEGSLAEPQPIIGPVAGVLGSLQAITAIKLLTGIGDAAAGTITRFNGMDSTFGNEVVARRADCSACCSTRGVTV